METPKIGNTLHLKSHLAGGLVTDVAYTVVDPRGQKRVYKLGENPNVTKSIELDDTYDLAIVPSFAGQWKYEVKAVVGGETVSAYDTFAVEGVENFLGTSIKIDAPDVEPGENAVEQQPVKDDAMADPPDVKDDVAEETEEPVLAAQPTVNAAPAELAVKMMSHAEAMKASQYFSGSAMKALGNGKVGGYLVVFGGEKDAQGEYFKPNCEFHLDWFDTATRPVLYHHGLLDEDMIEEIGKTTLLRRDARGLWCEAQLDMSNPVAEDVYNMIMRGEIGWSSGSAPHLSHVNDDGGIDEWAIVEASLTPTPAAGKRTSVQAIKFNPYSSTEIKHPKGAGAPIEDLAVTTSETSIKRGTKMAWGNIIGAMETAGADPEMIVAVLKEMTGAGGGEEAPVGDDAEMMADPASVPADTSDMVAQPEKAWTQTGDGGAEIRDTGSKPPTTPPGQSPAPAPGSKAMPEELSAKAVADAIRKQFLNMRTEPAQTKSAGFVGSNPARQTAPRITDMRTPYHNLGYEDMAFLHQIRRSGKNPRDMGQAFEREMADKAMKAFNAGKLELDVETTRKVAMKVEFNNTGVAGDGGNWVPDLWSSALWQRVRIDNNVAKNIEVFQMPSPTFEYPIESTDPSVYAVGESDTDAEQTLATNVFTRSKLSVSKLQFVAKKVGLQVGFSTEIEEDSIIPFIPQLRAQATRAFANSIDNLLINSDSVTGTGNINYKGANTSAAPTAKFLFGGGDGFRKNALVTNTAVLANFAGGVPTLQALRTLRFKLINSTQAYGIDPDQLMWVCDPYTYGKMLSIDELNVYMNNGRNATVNSGLVQDFDGSPIFPSAEMLLADNTGYYPSDNSGTLGNILIVAKNAWKVGYVRQVMSDVSYVPWNDSYILTMTARFAIGKKDTVASGLGYNILVS